MHPDWIVLSSAEVEAGIDTGGTETKLSADFALKSTVDVVETRGKKLLVVDMFRLFDIFWTECEERPTCLVLAIYRFAILGSRHPSSK